MLVGVFATGAVASAQTVCIEPHVDPGAPTIPIWPKSFGKADEPFPSYRILGVDAAGNAYVTGQTADSTAKIGLWKYLPNGTLAQTVQSPTYNDCGCSTGGQISNGHGMVVVVGNATPISPEQPYRRIFVAGTVKRGGTGYDVVVSSFLSSETYPWPQLVEEWTCCWNHGEQNGTDYPVAMVLDKRGTKLWIAAASDGNMSGSDIELLSVGIDGSGLSHMHRWGGPKTDLPVDIAMHHDVQSQGQTFNDDLVFVTGTTYQGASSDDIVTFCYEDNTTPGNTPLRWQAIFTGGYGQDTSSSMALQTAGGTIGLNVFVAGTSYQGTTYGHDYVTLGYDGRAGATNTPTYTNTPRTGWPEYYNGSASGTDSAVKVALACPEAFSTNVYVTGAATRTQTGSLDIVTIGYTSTGGVSGGSGAFFENVYEDHDYEDRPTDLLVTPISVCGEGVPDVYVCGLSSNGSNFDYVTLRLVPANGVEEGAVRHNASGQDRASSVRFGPFSSEEYPYLYTVGRSFTGTDTQYSLLRYTQCVVPCPCP